MSKRILLVDDDEMMVDVISQILKQAGYTVTSATGGEIGKFLVVLKEFDAIISDIRMPQVSGFDVLEIARKFHDTPVILMSGTMSILPGEAMEMIGADAFLSKPFSKNELMEALAKVSKRPAA